MPRPRHIVDPDLAKQLFEARKEAGFTQQELAERLGISRIYVGRIESGQRSPRMPLIRAWLRECGYVLETISPGSPDAAGAIADALSDLPEEELELALRVLRAWSRIPREGRNAILAIVSAYEA